MTSFNRALQVRVANRLRERLAHDEGAALPLFEGLSELELREVCEVGGGRLAAIGILLCDADVHSVVGCIRDEVRRTDVLGMLDRDVLLLIVPGLDPIGGHSLLDRLRTLLDAVPGVSIGIAYRSSASCSGWTARALAGEAAANALPRHGDTARIGEWRIRVSA
jgi:hypothetical protein